MKTFNEFRASLSEDKISSYDFDLLDGPISKKVSGGAIGLKGTSPEDALLKHYNDWAYKVLNIKKNGDIFTVQAVYKTDASRKEQEYFRLKNVQEK